jgi:hypothetical protein
MNAKRQEKLDWQLITDKIIQVTNQIEEKIKRSTRRRQRKRKRKPCTRNRPQRRTNESCIDV